ncbi:hypothetical protein RYX36_012228, partial [Vicia faba]
MIGYLLVNFTKLVSPIQTTMDSRQRKVRRMMKLRIFSKWVGKRRRIRRVLQKLVEDVLVELEITAEEDAELNRQFKPIISKLKKLHLLQEVLS